MSATTATLKSAFNMGVERGVASARIKLAEILQNNVANLDDTAAKTAAYQMTSGYPQQPEFSDNPLAGGPGTRSMASMAGQVGGLALGGKALHHLYKADTATQAFKNMAANKKFVGAFGGDAATAARQARDMYTAGRLSGNVGANGVPLRAPDMMGSARRMGNKAMSTLHNRYTNLRSAGRWGLGAAALYGMSRMMGGSKYPEAPVIPQQAYASGANHLYQNAPQYAQMAGF